MSDIKDRIVSTLKGRGKVTHYFLMNELFPDKKSWGRSSNGGPPGCTMVLGKALRELKKDGVCADWYSGGRRYVKLLEEIK